MGRGGGARSTLQQNELLAATGENHKIGPSQLTAAKVHVAIRDGRTISVRSTTSLPWSFRWRSSDNITGFSIQDFVVSTNNYGTSVVW